MAQLQNVAHTRIDDVCVSVLWRALEPRRGELRRRRGPGQVVQFVRALAVDHPSPREGERVERGRASRCIIMHFSTLLVLYCKYLGASLFQRRLCLSRVGFVNASPLSFIPCPTVTRRFFLPFYKQPKNGSRAGSYDEHPYLWALPFPLFSTLFVLPLLPLFTFEGAGGAGGSVLFQLLSYAPSCPGFHLRHMQYRCEKVSVRIGYVPFFLYVGSLPLRPWREYYEKEKDCSEGEPLRFKAS